MPNGLLNNLIGYWGLDEASGANNATDKHTNGLTLTQYNSPGVVHALADDVILEATNLQLYGMTTSTGAVGTYAGKIKVRINGTDRYIPYYAS